MDVHRGTAMWDTGGDAVHAAGREASGGPPAHGRVGHSSLRDRGQRLSSRPPICGFLTGGLGDEHPASLNRLWRETCSLSSVRVTKQNPWVRRGRGRAPS